MIRHFTATAFVVRGGATLLHWHRRLQQWMPPGGHIEPNEDPVQAVLREVHEETGLVAEVIPARARMAFDYPAQLPAPYTILVEDIPGPGEPHKHIDLIYFCREVDGGAHEQRDDPTLRWVDESELRDAGPLDVVGCGIAALFDHPAPAHIRLAHAFHPTIAREPGRGPSFAGETPH